MNDTRAALLCGSWIEVVDLADGTSQWRHDFAAHRDPRMFVHGDEIWFYVNDGPTFAYRRTIYRVSDGSVVAETATNRPPVDMAWTQAGKRFEVQADGVLDSQPRWMLLKTYDDQDQESWGDTAFASTGFGISKIALGADGNFYFAARDTFHALAPDGSLMWATSCPAGYGDMVLLDDGSPLLRCGGRYSLFDTNTPLTSQSAKPSIALPSDAEHIRELPALDRIATTGPRSLGLYSGAGSSVTTVAADSGVADDGFHGPEFGLQAAAGATGALVQTSEGISLVDYTTAQPRWSKDRFFLPVAADADGFIGVCERPSDADGLGSVVDDHITLCGLTEGGSPRWRVEVPWASYGVTPRHSDGFVSRWQGEGGDFVQAVQAKRWIVSTSTGTYAIAGM